jgi:predicted transcriptional regulator
MNSTAIHQTTLKLDVGTKERVNRLAKSRNRTPHWMMLEAIRQFADREEQRESFRQDGILAWQEYQNTGLHVSHGEANAWLSQLAAGKDVEPPQCHV